MRKSIFLHDFVDQPDHLQDIHKSLSLIQDKLLNELSAKQDTIEALEEKLNSLENVIREKNLHIKELNQNLETCKKTTEGNRQVINKLLNQMERLQQDIEWYMRTYEKRSFLGYLKEKLIGGKKNK